MASYDSSNSPESPSKKLKPEAALDNAQAADLGQETLSIELIQGGFELIRIQQKIGQDGFYNVVRKDMAQRGMLTQRLNLIRFVTCRKSPTEDYALLNARTNSHGQSYPRQLILRVVEKSTEESRRACLADLCKFLNDKADVPTPDNKIAYALHQKRLARHQLRYIVPLCCDATPADELRKLGDIVTSQHAIETIMQCFDHVNRSWAIENPDLADCFFNKPYPETAMQELGYED